MGDFDQAARFTSQAAWKTALEDFDMTESKVLNSWIKEASLEIIQDPLASLPPAMLDRHLQYLVEEAPGSMTCE
jgi:hypothetical protein